MNEWTKAYLKVTGICAAASAALFGVYYGLGAFESKMTDKRRLERELEESERLRKRLEERLEDTDAQNTILDRRVGILQFENSRLKNDLNVAEKKAAAKAPVDSKRSDILVE